MQAINRYLCVCISIGLLAACGGGSDGGSVTPTAAPPATITSANAPAIAASVFNSVQTSADLDDFGSMFVLQGAAVGRNAGPGGLYLKFLDSLAAKTVGVQLQVELPPTDVSQELCTNFPDGSAIISGEVDNPAGSITQGDRIAADFSNCDFGAGLVLSGGWEITIDSFSPLDLFENPAVTQFQLTLSIDFQNLSVSESGQTYSADGDVATTIDTTVLSTSTVSVSGSRLSLTDGTRVETLSGYSISVSVDESTGDYVLTASGTLEGSLFAGSVTFNTTTPFQGTGFGDPDFGVLEINGANGASITLTASNNMTVQIDVVDADGMSETLVTTWDELRVLL
jgi:hypothetical protein